MVHNRAACVRPRSFLTHSYGISHVFQGNYEQAELLYQRAIAIWEAALGREHPQVAAGLNNRAELLRAQVGVDLFLRTREVHVSEREGEGHQGLCSKFGGMLHKREISVGVFQKFLVVPCVDVVLLTNHARLLIICSSAR